MAATVMGRMIEAGHVQQDSESTVILNSASGVLRFCQDGLVPNNQADIEVDFEGEGMEDGDLKKK